MRTGEGDDNAQHCRKPQKLNKDVIQNNTKQQIVSGLSERGFYSSHGVLVSRHVWTASPAYHCGHPLRRKSTTTTLRKFGFFQGSSLERKM